MEVEIFLMDAEIFLCNSKELRRIDGSSRINVFRCRQYICWTSVVRVCGNECSNKAKDISIYEVEAWDNVWLYAYAVD